MQRLLLTVVELKDCKNSKGQPVSTSFLPTVKVSVAVPRGTQGHYTELSAATTTDAVSLMTQVAESGSTEPSPERRSNKGSESKRTDAAPKATPPTSPERRNNKGETGKGPLVFTLDTNRSTFAYDGHPTKSRPFKVSVLVKNIDVLSHLDTIGATEKKYDFWLPPPSEWRELKQEYDASLADNRDNAPDSPVTKTKSEREREIEEELEDEEISKALLMEAVGEGFSVLPFHPVHPAPPTQRGLSGKLVLRWTIISEDTIRFSYRQVQDLLLRRYRLHLNALKEREVEERPVERGRSSEARQTSPQSTRRNDSEKKGVYREYQMPPYHNPFNTPRCHQTAKPFSELREAREAEFYSKLEARGGSRYQRRPHTNPTPAQSDPTLRRRESAEGVSPLRGPVQPTTHRPGTTGGGEITQRHLLSWAVPGLSSYASQQSWLPSFAAMESLHSQQEEKGLRREEKRRMKLAVATEAARREQEDEEMVMADPAAEPQPEQTNNTDPLNGRPRQPLHSVSPSKNRASVSSKSPRSQRYRVVANYIYRQAVRPPSGTKLAVLLNPAPPPPDRKAYLQSTNSNNIFDHLYQSSTQVSSARSIRGRNGQKSVERSTSADTHESQPRDSDAAAAATPAEGERGQTDSKQQPPPPPPPLNPRLYRLRSSDPAAALKEANEWKQKLDELRKIHPAMQQRERAKKADELDKLFVA
jgi:hypothetical protein